MRFLMAVMLAVISLNAWGQIWELPDTDIMANYRLRLVDSATLYYGNNGNVRTKWNSVNSRVESSDPSGNLLTYTSDIGTTGAFGVTGNLLAGVLDQLAGSMSIYGNSTTTGGLINLYNGHTVDGAVDAWRFAGLTNGDFAFHTVGGTGGTRTFLLVDDATLASTFNGASHKFQIAGVDRLYIEPSGQVTFSAGINTTNIKIGGTPLSFFHLADMSNTGIADNKYLKWNASTGKGEWANPTISATVDSGDDIGDFYYSAVAPGQILVRNADNTQFVTTAISGGGTLSPTGVLTIIGSEHDHTTAQLTDLDATGAAARQIIIRNATNDGYKLLTVGGDLSLDVNNDFQVANNSHFHDISSLQINLHDVIGESWGTPVAGQVLSFNGTDPVWTDPAEVGPLASLQGIGDVANYVDKTAGDVLVQDGDNWYNRHITGLFLLSSTGVATINDDTVTLGTHTQGEYVKQLLTGTGLTGGAAASEGGELTIAHATGEGYTHIPSAGSTGQILQYNAAGEAKWISISGNATLADDGALDLFGIDISSDTNLSATGGVTLTGDQLSHTTGDGYNHIPSGGSAGQMLRWSSNGTATWVKQNRSFQINAGIAPASSGGCTGGAADSNGNVGSTFNATQKGYFTFFLPPDWDGSAESIKMNFANTTSATVFTLKYRIVANGGAENGAFSVGHSIASTTPASTGRTEVSVTDPSGFCGTSANDAGKEITIEVSMPTGANGTIWRGAVVEY